MPVPISPPRRAFKRHLLAWIVAGIGCGWFGMPSWSVTNLLAFAVSGCIVGLVMGLATYPISRQPVLIWVGAVCGATMGCLGAWQSTAATGENLPGLCLMIGSVIGSTAAIWQTPLRLAQRALAAAAIRDTKKGPPSLVPVFEVERTTR
jgi:hypothetical protein